MSEVNMQSCQWFILPVVIFEERIDMILNSWCKKQENTKAVVLEFNLKAFLPSLDLKFEERTLRCKIQYLLIMGTGGMGDR